MFNWIDISATGTAALTTGDDSNLGPFPIGFPFEFYGNTFTTFRVCSNGFISFSSTADRLQQQRAALGQRPRAT